MRRIRVLGLVSIGALLQCGGDEPGAVTDREVAVLDVVVDSLPFVIHGTWGMGDRPYTALISSAAPSTRVMDPTPQVERSGAPPPRHTAAWLARQAGKDHVVGICSPEPDGEYCDFERATVVATVSRVRFTTDDRATVEVAVGRRDFGAIAELTLAQADFSWSLVDFEVIMIS